MPESKSRKKAAFTPPKSLLVSGTAKKSPRWWAPAMVTLMVLGLAWIVVAYVSQLAYPVPGIDYWNIAAGFAVALAGFSMTTRWK